jgi:putative membrane protein
MKGFLIKWLANIVALMAVLRIIPGIKADKWETVAIAALILGLVNAFLKPLIILLTLPLQVFSLGLFTFIINGLLFYSVSKIVKGFSVADFASAFWGALFFSFFSFALSLLINPQGRVEWYSRNVHDHRKPRYKDVIDVKGKSEK